MNPEPTPPEQLLWVLRKGRAVKIAGIFQHQRVLQRGKPIPVWGSASPGARVNVALTGAGLPASPFEMGVPGGAWAGEV
jgi:hypothetical protein